MCFFSLPDLNQSPSQPWAGSEPVVGNLEVLGWDGRVSGRLLVHSIKRLRAQVFRFGVSRTQMTAFFRASTEPQIVSFFVNRSKWNNSPAHPTSPWSRMLCCVLLGRTFKPNRGGGAAVFWEAVPYLTLQLLATPIGTVPQVSVSRRSSSHESCNRAIVQSCRSFQHLPLLFPCHFR